MTERVLDETPAGFEFPAVELVGWRERFGVIAGITTRGSAEAPFDLGLGGREPIGEVLGRWHRLEKGLEGFSAVVVGRQVHGTAIRWHDQAAGLCLFRDTDGHATRTPGIVLAVSAADCIPVYLVDPVRRAIALLHAGWRGTAAGMLAEGVRLLRERGGCDPSDLVVHCGVGICGGCYPVSSEVVSACGRPVRGPEGLFLDLRSVLADQARSQGVTEVTVSSHCSAHMRDRFMSHRGSGGTDGRMVAFLGLLN